MGGKGISFGQSFAPLYVDYISIRKSILGCVVVFSVDIYACVCGEGKWVWPIIYSLLFSQLKQLCQWPSPTPMILTGRVGHLKKLSESENPILLSTKHLDLTVFLLFQPRLSLAFMSDLLSLRGSYSARILKV